MWRKRNRKSVPGKAVTSVIDIGCEISGRIRFVGTLVVNGRFEGELVSADTLLVGEQGEVKAEIHVGTAIVSGKIKGNIIAQERVEMHSSARMFGDIESPVLVLDEGVMLDGRCKMTGRETVEAEKAQTGDGLGVTEDSPLEQRSYG